MTETHSIRPTQLHIAKSATDLPMKKGREVIMSENVFARAPLHVPKNTTDPQEWSGSLAGKRERGRADGCERSPLTLGKGRMWHVDEVVV